MGIKSYSPYTPSRRHMTGSDFSEITKSTPEKSLVVSLKKNAGRNNQGKITVRHKMCIRDRKYSEELYQAIKDSGMLFIVAAGNGDASGNGYSIDEQPMYPASFELDNIISVANLRFDGQLDRASNYGVRSVDLVAPGNYILSTITGNDYAYMSGTSMAAPMVTGTAAMLYSCDASLSLMDVRNRILQSARPLESLSGKVATGGMLDAGAAMP